MASSTSALSVSNLFGAICLGLAIFTTLTSVGNSRAQETVKPAVDQNKSKPAKAPQFVASNWTMGCNPTGTDNKLVCQASQTIVTKKGGQTLLAVSVAPWEQKYATEANVLRVQLPHGLSIPVGVQINIDDKTAYSLVIQTSDATGLYARIGLSEKILLAMTKGKTLTVNFAAMNGRKFQIPMTLKGFSAVFNKLQ
jgi:invasion protein IalB